MPNQDTAPEKPDATGSGPDPAHLRLAVAGAGLGLMEWDVRSDTFVIDAGFAEMLGRPELATAAFDFSRIAEMTHPDDRQHVADELGKVNQRPGYGFDVEHRVIRPGGNIVWLRVRASAVQRAADGTPLRMVGVAEDRTQAKADALALDNAKQRMALAIEASGAGVWDWDIPGGAVYWNDRLRQMLGVGADDPIEYGQLGHFIHPDDQLKFRTAIDAHISDDAPYALVLRMVRPDAKVLNVRVRGMIQRDTRGAPVRMAGTVVDITAEAQAEAHAAASDARAALALDAAGLILVETELARAQMVVSGTFADLLARPDLAGETVTTKDVWTHIHPGDYDQVRQRYDELASGVIRTSSLEIRMVRGDGEERWISINASRPLAADGQPGPRLLSVIADLTQRKRAELALAESEERFERAIEGSLIAIWDWDIATGQMHWSRRLREIFKLTPQDSVPSIEDAMALVHPADRDSLIAMQRRHFEDDAPFDLQFRAVRSDESVLLLRARGAAQRDEAGKPVRFVGSLIDITREQAARDAARLAGRRAQYALAAADLGLWEFDASSRAITMNERLGVLLGRPDLAGRALSEEEVFAFTAPEDLERVQSHMAAVALGHQDVMRSEHRVVHADGRRIWILAHVGAAERDSRGRAARIIGITQDLSQQKGVEQDLREAKERAEAANEAKSSFLATMSHEIRTPLNGVLGMSQLLALGALDDQQRGYVQTILDSGRSLSAIINDVLDISRIEAGRMELAPAPCQVADIITAAIDPARGPAKAKGLAINVDDTGLDGQTRRLDATRMSQILANLVSNAVKFTDAGQVRVRAFHPAPDRLRVEVEDDGPGVADDMRAIIFNRFTQADMSKGRAHGGAGLGLAIARELAELAGGAVGLAEAGPEGACFWFEVPAMPTSDTAPRVQPDLTAEIAGARILVVEDHNVNRAATLELLEVAGFETLEADNAQTALALLRDAHVDAVLLDLHMPGEGGDAVLRAIRAGDAGPRDLPAFFVSADVTVQARESMQSLGADGYFAKPMEFSAIRQALSHAIASRRQ